MPTDSGVAAGKVVRVASWQDADRTSLVTHRPEATDVVVVLGTDRAGPRH